MIPKRMMRKSAGAVSALAVVAAVAAGSAASGAPSTTLQLSNTIHLISKGTSSTKVGGSHTVATSTLTTRKSGRTIGSGVFTCVPSSDPGVLKCTSAFALAGGILVARETINLHTHSLAGTVMNGSGKYKSATGTIKGTGIVGTGAVDITIKYSTG